MECLFLNDPHATVCPAPRERATRTAPTKLTHDEDPMNRALHSTTFQFDLSSFHGVR